MLQENLNRYDKNCVSFKYWQWFGKGTKIENRYFESIPLYFMEFSPQLFSNFPSKKAKPISCKVLVHLTARGRIPAEGSSELVVVAVVVVVVNFSHFHLFLQNHWNNFNQTWHKASFRERDSN